MQFKKTSINAALALWRRTEMQEWMMGTKCLIHIPSFALVVL